MVSSPSYHDDTDSGKWKSRNFCLMLYPDEDITHLDALNFIRSNYRYGAICHNSDMWTAADESQNPDHKAGEFKKPHFHVVVQFTTPRWSSAVAKELGITENYIQKCRSLEGALKYLVHADHSDKVQYDTDAVEGQLKIMLDKLLSQVTEDERIIQLILLLDSFETKVTYQGFVRVVCSKGLYSDFRRSALIFSNLIREHNEMFVE